MAVHNCASVLGFGRVSEMAEMARINYGQTDRGRDGGIAPPVGARKIPATEDFDVLLCETEAWADHLLRYAACLNEPNPGQCAADSYKRYCHAADACLEQQ